MSEISVILSWIISLTKMGIFGALFAFSIVLVRVSKLREIKYFVLATLCFMVSSLFELINAIGYLDSAFEVIERGSSIVLSKLFLIMAAAFLFIFLYTVNKSIKQYL